MDVKRAWRFAAAAALGVLAGSASWAQDEAAGESSPQPAAVKPMPAEIMPRTPQSLLLDIKNTGAHLIAVGDRGAILVSNNGKDWAQVEVPVRAALTTVAFADPQHGWAAGHDAAILHTEDGGRTWKLQNFQPEIEKPVLSLLALDTQRALAVGAYGLMLETTDAGSTWNEVDTLGFNEDELHLNAIAKLNNGDLFIAGEQGLMAISTDAGASWQKQASPYDGSYFGVLPHGEKGALVFGLRGNVYLSDDARSGKWTQVQAGTVASMFGGAAVPGDGEVLVGLNGVIVTVAADGKVETLQSPAGTPLSGVLPYGDVLLAVGESGVQSIPLSRPLK
ncbi:WD40/YVTN/BNR-like repeat-containing protein [Solimonas variicoloris]|uniref:WD40/YVTN/BNR-like repeat-containing protein n=1 Tax=Solimonas variicoloris TaxID=254408 RepID=UPI00039D83B1|nr:YCF48-related protein [Solimonas variicoloris]